MQREAMGHAALMERHTRTNEGGHALDSLLYDHLVAAQQDEVLVGFEATPVCLISHHLEEVSLHPWRVLRYGYILQETPPVWQAGAAGSLLHVLRPTKGDEARDSIAPDNKADASHAPSRAVAAPLAQSAKISFVEGLHEGGARVPVVRTRLEVLVNHAPDHLQGFLEEGCLASDELQGGDKEALRNDCEVEAAICLGSPARHQLAPP